MGSRKINFFLNLILSVQIVALNASGEQVNYVFDEGAPQLCIGKNATVGGKVYDCVEGSTSKDGKVYHAMQVELAGTSQQDFEQNLNMLRGQANVAPKLRSHIGYQTDDGAPTPNAQKPPSEQSTPTPAPAPASQPLTTPPVANPAEEVKRKIMEQEKQIPDVSPTQDLVRQFNKFCKPAIETAQKCCQHPEQCLGESVGADGSQNSMVLSVLQGVLSAAGQAASLSGACGKMQNVALTVTAINAALATKCTAKIYKCKSECQEIVQEAQRRYALCADDASTCTGYERPTAVDDETADSFRIRNERFTTRLEVARSDLITIGKGKASCAENENYAMNQVNQTVASALTAKTMGLCREASSNGSQVSAANAAFNVDCSSAANAANPACQNVCNRAGSQNDPACNPNLAGNGYGTNNGRGLNSGLNNSLGSGGLDEIENAQDILSDRVDPNPNRAQLGVAAGGGGVGGGGGGGLGGFDPQGAGGGDGGTGFDPRTVGAGFRSGSGYSAAGGRGLASAGGAGGYSAPVGKSGTTAGQPFNPKDYLPGGRLDPKRKLAGLAATTPEIGAVHGDIFRSITNRFYQICLRDGLYDCATLRRSGTQGN